MIKRPKTPNKNLVEAKLLISSSTVRMLCPARMEVCIRPDRVGQQPQEWNIVMSQPNFDPNHNPYQQNPQPNQGQYQQPYPPGQPIYVTQQTNDVSMVAMWGHLSGLLGGFIIPLVIWAIYKDKPGYELARRAAARARRWRRRRRRAPRCARSRNRAAGSRRRPARGWTFRRRCARRRR